MRRLTGGKWWVRQCASLWVIGPDKYFNDNHLEYNKLFLNCAFYSLFRPDYPRWILTWSDILFPGDMAEEGEWTFTRTNLYPLDTGWKVFFIFHHGYISDGSLSSGKFHGSSLSVGVHILLRCLLEDCWNSPYFILVGKNMDFNQGVFFCLE